MKSSQFKKVNPLYGLVLTGGKSTRMQMDKSILEYHGIKQSEYCFDLLSGFCDKVFISNREDQTLTAGQKGDHAEYSGIGPLAGILSAMDEYPRVDWLILACDLPYINDRTIERLVQKRNRKKMATAYISYNEGLPEPLCAIYEARFRSRLLNFLKKGIDCPRKIMLHSPIELIRQKDRLALENINSPEEYKTVIQKLKKNAR